MDEIENVKNKKEKVKREIWNIAGTIIKNSIVLIILGVIIFFVASLGADVYHKNSTEFISYGFWSFHKYLNDFYGLIGLFIYVLTNCLAFFIYNYSTSKFKNNKTIISKILFLLFNILFNLLMLLPYSSIFGNYSFKNEYLDFFNTLIIKYGTCTFPITFLVIYIVNLYKLKR